nr:immunoglobulin light chain junction region [Macaca mulatta]
DYYCAIYHSSGYIF